MRLVVQRVTRASVRVDDGAGGELVGEIGRGLLVLVGVTHGDDEAIARALAGKVHRLRVLRGIDGREESLADRLDHAALVVSQFTLYGDTRRGRRPSWSAAAPGAVAEPLVTAFVMALRELGTPVSTGRFGADMAIDCVNDGPVTLLIDSARS